MLHGDAELAKAILSIIRQRGIRAFVETGAWGAETCEWLSPQVEKLYTNETDPVRFEQCKLRVGGIANVTLSKTPSPQFLEEFDPPQPILLRLDAHPVEVEASEKPWPLLGELAVIARRWPEAVVIVDDFCVPPGDRFPGHATVPHEGCTVPLDARYLKKYIRGRRVLIPDYPGSFIGYAIIVNGEPPDLTGFVELV